MISVGICDLHSNVGTILIFWAGSKVGKSSSISKKRLYYGLTCEACEENIK